MCGSQVIIFDRELESSHLDDEGDRIKKLILVIFISNYRMKRKFYGFFPLLKLIFFV